MSDTTIKKETLDEIGCGQWVRDRLLAALRAYVKALELDKRHVKAYHGTAIAWFRLGKYQKALDNLNKCLDFDRHNADTLLLRSKVHDKLGNYGSASKDRMDACRIKPSLCDAR